ELSGRPPPSGRSAMGRPRRTAGVAEGPPQDVEAPGVDAIVCLAVKEPATSGRPAGSSARTPVSTTPSNRAGLPTQMPLMESPSFHSSCSGRGRAFACSALISTGGPTRQEWGGTNSNEDCSPVTVAALSPVQLVLPVFRNPFRQ